MMTIEYGAGQNPSGYERDRDDLKDPLGNPLKLSRVRTDCPYETCGMMLPHYHSIIPSLSGATTSRGGNRIEGVQQRAYRQGFIDAITMAYQHGLARTRAAAEVMQKYQGRS